MTSSARGPNSGYDGSRLDHHCNGVSVLYAMSTMYFASYVAMSPLGLLMVAIDDDSKASAKSLNFFIAGSAHLPVLLAV